MTTPESLNMWFDVDKFHLKYLWCVHGFCIKKIVFKNAHVCAEKAKMVVWIINWSRNVFKLRVHVAFHIW